MSEGKLLCALLLRLSNYISRRPFDFSRYIYIYIYFICGLFYFSTSYICKRDTSFNAKQLRQGGGAHLNARCKLYEQFVCLPPKTASITSLEFRNQWNSYLTIKWRSKLKFCFSRLFSWKFRVHCPKEIKISLDVQIKPFSAVQSFLPLCSGDFNHSD